MLNVVVVQVGNYLDRGGEYVSRAFTSLSDNLKDFRDPRRYWCITDDPKTLPANVTTIPNDEGVDGWWNKLSMFKPGVFPKGERVLYFDLDQLIIGDMSEIAACKSPFAASKDFYSNLHINSSVMIWEAGAYDHIWTTWDQCGRPQWDKRGDQFWIETMLEGIPVDFLQDLYPAQIVSLKADCRALGGVPPGVRMVCFHGKPRPHEVNFDLDHYFRNMEN